MKANNVYNKSFEHTIEIYAKLLVEYDKTTETFGKTGNLFVVKHTNKNGSTNIMKNPIYLIIERQRSDLILYARELGLTPSGLKKLNEELTEKKLSGLERALSGI